MMRARWVAAVMLGAVVLMGAAPRDVLAKKKPKGKMSAKLDGKAFKSKAVVVTHIGTSFGVSGGTAPRSLRIGTLIRTIGFLCEVDLGTLTPPATLTQASSQCGAQYVETHLGVPTQKRWQSSALSVTFTKVAGRIVQGQFEGTFPPTSDHAGDPTHTVTKGKFSIVLAGAGT